MIKDVWLVFDKATGKWYRGASRWGNIGQAKVYRRKQDASRAVSLYSSFQLRTSNPLRLPEVIAAQMEVTPPLTMGSRLAYER